MTKQASISKADLKRMAAIAKREGVIVEVDVNGRIIRVKPNDIEERQPRSELHSMTSEGSIGAKFVERLRASREAKTRTDKEVALYHELGPEKYRKLSQERHREWAANLPNEPLDKRERLVLEQLAQQGIGVRIQNVKQLGPGTYERLHLRGFIENSFREKFPDRHYEYWITAAGMEAWERLGAGD